MTRHTAWQRLVAAYEAFTAAPLPQKILTFALLALPAQVVASSVFLLSLRISGLGDMHVVVPLAIAGPGVLGTAVLLAGAGVRRGWDCAWLPYVVFGLYGVYMAALSVGLGTWSTAYSLMLPSAPIAFGVLFGVRYGWFAIVTAGASLTIGEGLRLTDVMPYAPALVDGPPEVTGWWLVGNAVPLTMFVVAAVGAAMVTIATVEIQGVRLAAQAEGLRRSHDIISRYVPRQVAEAVSERGTAATMHERRKITVFFSDVVGFTEITERLAPEELARVLNEYFTAMTRIADRYDGTVDELVGDAVLILFGAPTATDDHDHARRAVAMALDMQAEIAELNRGWATAGIDVELAVRMGVDTGVVTVGNFGSADRVKYAALGRHVNLASRLQTHAEPGEVLISHATWLLVHDVVDCAARGEVELKGVGRPTRIYELVRLDRS